MSKTKKEAKKVTMKQLRTWRDKKLAIAQANNDMKAIRRVQTNYLERSRSLPKKEVKPTENRS